MYTLSNVASRNGEMGSSSSRVSRSEELAFERSELSELSLDEYWWLGSVPGMLSSDWDRCVHTQRELLDIVDRAWIRNEDLDENRRLQRGKDTSRGMDAESSRCDDGDLRVHVDVGCLGYFAHRVLLSREERDRDEKDEEEDEDWASTIQAVESVCANGTRLGARMEDLVPLVQLQLSGRTLSRSAYDRYGSSQGVSLFRCLVSLEVGKWKFLFSLLNRRLWMSVRLSGRNSWSLMSGWVWVVAIVCRDKPKVLVR